MPEAARALWLEPPLCSMPVAGRVPCCVYEYQGSARGREGNERGDLACAGFLLPGALIGAMVAVHFRGARGFLRVAALLAG